MKTAHAAPSPGTTVDDLLSLDQFSLDHDRKVALLLPLLQSLTEHHVNACPPYRRVLNAMWHGGRADSLETLPYLPVGLFKNTRLSSVPQQDVFTVIHSSGTTNRRPSEIVLDRRTADLQARALFAVLRDVLGRQRLPMMVVDARSQLRAAHARSVGVRGMLPFGRPSIFALNDSLEIDRGSVTGFMDRYGAQPFVIFGFTYMVWRFVHAAADLGLDFSNATLIHTGGWKTLSDQSVSNQDFKRACRTLVNLPRVYNFYGMVEQTGSVFLEGVDGFLYAPLCADVIVRDPETLRPVPFGTPGVLQVLSALPASYPGHSLLTEDLAVIHGIDDGPCGRQGRYFSILGRLPRAEIRGCGDIAVMG